MSKQQFATLYEDAIRVLREVTWTLKAHYHDLPKDRYPGPATTITDGIDTFLKRVDASSALSEIAPNVLGALQTINEMARYACEEDIDSRYAMLLRIGETARAILNAAPQASPSVAPAVHVGPAVAAPASAPSATPCSGWIPVGERMPEKETETCSVDAVFKDVHGDGFVGYAYLDEAYKGKAFCRASRSNKMFTHWKPLAEATHG